MSQGAREAIKKWVVWAAEEPEPVKTRHLDELGIAGLRPSLKLLEAVFRTGVRMTEQIGGDWRFALVVALMPSENLRLDRCRDLKHHLRRQSDMEPASVCLLPPDASLGTSWQEEYRFPLERNVKGLDQAEYRVFFSQSRPEGEIDLDDVFYDSVCFEQLQRRLRSSASREMKPPRSVQP